MSTTAADVRVVCQMCSEVFHPRSLGQRFCSRPCVDAARRKRRVCRRNGCDAPPRSHGAKHCQMHADEAAQQRAAEVTQRRRKPWLPRPKAPTEVQLAAFLRNRDREDTPAERGRARFELALLERARVEHLATLSNVTYLPTAARR